MILQNKNNFSKAVRVRLVQLDWTVKDLAQKIDRPRETVSRALRSTRYPIVRKQVARKLKLELPDAA